MKTNKESNNKIFYTENEYTNNLIKKDFNNKIFYFNYDEFIGLDEISDKCFSAGMDVVFTKRVEIVVHGENIYFTQMGEYIEEEVFKFGLDEFSCNSKVEFYNFIINNK